MKTRTLIALLLSLSQTHHSLAGGNTSGGGVGVVNTNGEIELVELALPETLKLSPIVNGQILSKLKNVSHLKSSDEVKASLSVALETAKAIIESAKAQPACHNFLIQFEERLSAFKQNWFFLGFQKEISDPALESISDISNATPIPHALTLSTKSTSGISLLAPANRQVTVAYFSGSNSVWFDLQKLAAFKIEHLPGLIIHETARLDENWNTQDIETFTRLIVNTPTSPELQKFCN